ncbi:glycosyltransferase 1 domain-containing protein 1 [Cynoglossus semilaevis]|uniref:glycosyltransferase 1 domain-containing protein 1 n=1 Tax=Cynoglossus semilaevis TaxID=244447 RepID=UPI000D62BE2B|nr:glycosyltransferase 1 domain-containing protein 1 [Cynoglossus semilaevis]
MKILFLACLSPKTGNNTTAERIRSYVEAAGHTCELRDAAEFGSPAEVAALVSRRPPFDGALAIHLYKAGRLLLGKKTTTTPQTHTHRCPVSVVQKVHVCLKRHRFDNGLNRKATLCYGLSVFSPGVVSDRVDQLQVFLLVCGLRRVKDPLYLVQAFSEWHRENPLNVLIIIGPKIDPVFSAQVETVVHRTAGVFLTNERSQEELHASMRRCCALVNSSVSEGMSAAVLEAMDLGVPVLVRDVPGNAALVRHEFNGLLFSSPQDFVVQSRRLVSDQELRHRLVLNGRTYGEDHHSLDQERETYQRLVDLLR